jgi:hypothetical protein
MNPVPVEFTAQPVTLSWPTPDCTSATTSGQVIGAAGWDDEGTRVVGEEGGTGLVADGLCVEASDVLGELVGGGVTTGPVHPVSKSADRTTMMTLGRKNGGVGSFSFTIELCPNARPAAVEDGYLQATPRSKYVFRSKTPLSFKSIHTRALVRLNKRNTSGHR